MFKKLFGGPSTTAAPTKSTPAIVDVSTTMETLANQIENVEKRGKVLENKINGLKVEALTKKKAKDTRGKSFEF